MKGGLEFVNTDYPDILELKNIKQVYGDHVVFDGNLNFLVEDKPDQGQFVCILGTSGCGKSTLLRYICGLQEPTSGEILISAKPRTQEDRIGMVFQQYSSLPWYTVYQNVGLGLKYKNIISKKERHDKIMKFIELVGLKGHEDKYAKYPTLSGGQLQRVSIARSLIVEPPIIVMDEPFGALDVRTRLQMQELIAKIWKNIQTTIIFVTHDIPESVFLGDDIFMMKANPGEFVHYHHVDLPLERTRDLKRDSYFNKLVYQIEDEMMELSSKK
ncbi:MAG: nitrate/sulfonate/bicarbonate ABC transporter ATP-binding protein [Spirochaetes bacterium RBG_16_49_21]|nr:MAG: nitrate/sulfonate/bicarbonate ABC transporter ATP-binding protein [Spirochaetes bacterium RBG_16_49_21]